VRTEVPFTLPVGLSDARGALHRDGIMRLATARDELEPLRDAAVRGHAAYLAVLLLARTVTRIGTITEVTPEVVESLYAADFDHLQRVYERVNAAGDAVGVVDCPHCGRDFEIDLARLEDVGLGE
jgi:hypothetical protein